MHIDWWTLGLQAINAVVLIWLLAHFLFRPVAAMVAERQAAAAKITAEAKALETSAQADRAAARAAEADIAAQRAGLLRAASEEANREKQRLIAAARTEADRLRTIGRQDIDKMRAEAQRQSETDAADLAVVIAERLLGRLPQAAQVTAFLPGLGEGIDALPPQSRAELAQGDLTVRVVRPLSPEEAQALRTLLATRLDRRVDPTVEVDPSLIAGLELEGPHAEVRNSFRADLDRIAGTLAADG